MVDVLAIRMSKYQSNTDSALQIISDIVEYEVTRYHFNTIDYTRYNNEFNTIEYRFAKINFNYSDYVIQILTFIHITECIKHDAPFNIQYLELLYKVMKNLNNNNEPTRVIIRLAQYDYKKKHFRKYTCHYQ